MTNPPPPPPPHLGETTSQSVRRKLPYYVLGMAIGCVLVGLLIMARQMMIQPPPGGPAQAPAPAAAPTPSR